jgi:uncharacterized protein (DUF427 family)
MSGYPKMIAPVDHVEPVARRIRAQLSGATVLDTTGALYLWEWPKYPQYLIPVDGIDQTVLVHDEGTHKLSRDTVSKVGLRIGDIVRPSAGRRYVESRMPEIVDFVRFDWDALDAWYEEDEEVFVHPRNPYVRCAPRGVSGSNLMAQSWRSRPRR